MWEAIFQFSLPSGNLTSRTNLSGVTLDAPLYFPALNAIQRCPQIQIFRERLLARGKKKMEVVGAVMHKLIRVIYGVLKSGKPFDPEKLIPQTLDQSTDDDTSQLTLAL